jgi:glycosyltransferase involved in cell wall biosynthesis
MWDLSISGGSQRQALELARYLLRKGHTVKVYCAYLNRSKCYPELLNGLDITAMNERDYADSESRHKSWLWYPLEPLFADEARALADKVKDEFDILNPHDFQAYRVAYFCKRRRPAISIWMVNDLPRSLIVPRWSATRRGMLGFFHYYLVGGPLGRYVDKRRMRWMDGEVVFDKNTAAEFKRRTGHSPAQMGSGLDVSKFEFRKRESVRTKGRISVLGVGVFFPHRRYEDLLNAAALLKKSGIGVKVTIVGSDRYDPIYAKKVRDLVEPLGLKEDVTFLGEVDESELRRLYAEADAFAFPNHPQTWGLAPFEAMASGTPVIVSKAAGASDVLKHEDNALLVDPGKPEQIADCLRRLCEDPSRYAMLSRNGRRFVEENISWDAYGRRMEELFERGLARLG